MTTDNPQGTGSGTTFASAVLERLKSDTHLVLLSVFSPVASLAIGSFAIYRLIQGEFVVALFDGLLIAVISSVPEVLTDRVERFTFLAVALQVVVFCLVFALQTSRQYRQLDVMANRDPLTGVGNRRALDKFQSAIHERLRGPDGPVPDSASRFLGWHAITIQRLAFDPGGAMRVYFFNPNNDSGQDWGQDIVTSTQGNGELYGEASLPVAQFASRLYVFHYDPLEKGEPTDIPATEVSLAMRLAQASWALGR